MYNRQDVFKKHIQKKAEELNELCKQLGVVSFMSFAVKDCDNETEYKNYIYGMNTLICVGMLFAVPVLYLAVQPLRRGAAGASANGRNV